MKPRAPSSIPAASKIAHAGAAEAHDLAAAFIADTVDAPGPWRPLLEAWSDERRLPLATRRAVRIALVRARCFGEYS